MTLIKFPHKVTNVMMKIEPYPKEN